MAHTRARSVGFLAEAGPSTRDVERRRHLISSALHLPGDVMPYHISERLTEMYPERAVLETRDGDFDVGEYARLGGCTLTHKSLPYSERLVGWRRHDQKAVEGIENSWLEISWQGADLEVLIITQEGERCCFILAGDGDTARRFFREVCIWNTEVHGEVLVFQGGCWCKNEDLFRAIKGARFETLVLRGDLKERILEDARGFFAARQTYETYGVPWKRGILFAGPPGNGKTQAIKALTNTLGKPILYVKSFRSSDGPDEYGMRSVFERARAVAPCVLVLEDLDALVTEKNRSFLLNELDGFAANGGILTVATTNYPERLDPAIVKRPSRFDRLYRFDLPGVAERAAYIRQWNASLQAEMRLSEAGVGCIAERTDDFSFAYLKELFLSATMEWVSTPRAGRMDAITCDQVTLLREQMGSAMAARRDAGDGDDDE